MSAAAVVAAPLVGAGLAMTVTGWLLRLQSRQRSLAELLDLDNGEREVPVEVITESPEVAQVSRLTARIGELVGRLDRRGDLTRTLARAEIPMKTGEYLFLVGVAATIGGALVGFVFNQVLLGLLVAVVLGFAGRMYPNRAARKRTDLLRDQLAPAFSLIASSVTSGHTFLRSIQILGAEIPVPLADELRRVTAEVTLGSNLIDALEHFSDRVGITELKWAVKAVRIQQTTGGQLGEILHTLADFMRSREEVSREVKVLAAEGKFSGYVLMGLPVVVLAGMLVMNPNYLHPMFRGWGWVWLGVASSMLAIGGLIIRRLVKIEV